MRNSIKAHETFMKWLDKKINKEKDKKIIKIRDGVNNNDPKALFEFAKLAFNFGSVADALLFCGKAAKLENINAQELLQKYRKNF